MGLPLPMWTSIDTEHGATRGMGKDGTTGLKASRTLSLDSVVPTPRARPTPGAQGGPADNRSPVRTERRGEPFAQPCPDYY